jgi:hypothetical protein
VESPGVGQCAWLDRPISPDEPRVLMFEESLQNIQLIFSKDRGSAQSPRMAQVRAGWGPHLESVIQSLNGDLFYVHVYNNREREAFVVRRWGP